MLLHHYGQHDHHESAQAHGDKQGPKNDVVGRVFFVHKFLQGYKHEYSYIIIQ